MANETANGPVEERVIDQVDADARAAYDFLRPELRNEEGRCLTLQRLNVGKEDRSSIDRYRPLYQPRA